MSPKDRDPERYYRTGSQFETPSLYHPAPIGKKATTLAERKALFDSLNHFVTKHGGWIVSVPGDRYVDIQTLPESTLPDQLAALGYALRPDGFTDRLLAHAIQERFVRGANGTLEPLSEGSTRAIAEMRTHAGIVSVDKYWFLID
jgi:hypothetical protein